MVVTTESIKIPFMTFKNDTAGTSAENVPQASNEPARLSLPHGLVGIPDFNDVELVYAQEELPFLRLRQTKPDGLEFIVLEPFGFIPDYSVELNDDDLESLEIDSQEKVYLLNIVTIHNTSDNKVTINLVAPIVFNRSTFVGKQVIIKNFQDYSSSYILNDELRNNA